MRRDTEKPRWPVGVGPSPRHSQSPAIAPSAMAPICPNDPPMKTTIATAASAIGSPRSIRRQAVCHAPDRLRDHGNRDQLQTVKNALGERAGEGRRTEREGEENERRRHGEREPRRKPAEQAVAAQDAEREADLAGSGTWQELAERDDVGVAALAQPFPPLDEFGPEVAEMRDRSAERREAQFEEGGENLGHGARGLFRHAIQLQLRLKIAGTGNVTKRLGRPGNRCVRHPQSVGCPQHPEMKERFQATITHLRENISNAIESDLRDFGGSSHLPYQGLRPLRAEESKLPGASTSRADSLRTEQFLPEGKSRPPFTRHCVNSAFTGFLRSDITSSVPGTSDQAANCSRNFAWPLGAAKASSRYRSSPDPTSAGRSRSRSSAASMRYCR